MKLKLPNATEIEYEAAGEGAPVVLLHAFPLTGQMWRAQIDALTEKYHVIVPDLRGFGGTSGFTGIPSVNDMADDVVLLLDALKIAEPVTLGGLSMGGYVAFAFARAYPERLGRLILADTRAEADTFEGKTNRDKMIAFAEKYSAREVIDSMLPKMVNEQTQKQKPQVVDLIRQLASAQSTEGIVGALKALRDRPDSVGLLSTIEVPTLVIVGADDALTPPQSAAVMSNGIRGAKLVTIPESGHMSNLERPAQFNKAVEDFLSANVA